MQSRFQRSCFEKEVQRLARKIAADEQLAWPTLQRLATELDLDLWSREQRRRGEEEAPGRRVLEAVNDEAMPRMP